MAETLSAARGALAGLSPREKRLLILMGVVAAILAFAGVFWWSSTRLDALEHERAETVDALRFIQRARPRIAARTARRDALLLRYATRAPALTSFVEEQAHASNVHVAEAQDRPPTPAGRRFTERSVSIRMRQVSLQALADFMDRIDSAPFPVAISSVRLRKRFGEANSYDVDDMVISTWDQAPAAAAGGGGGRSTGTSGNDDSTGNSGRQGSRP